MKQSRSAYAGSQTARSNTHTKAKAKPGRRLQAWHVFLAAGVLGLCAYFLLPLPATQDTLRPLFNLANLGAFVAGILIHRPKRPLPWYLFTLAMLLFVLGIVTYVYYEVTLGRVPFPSLADALLIASYPCAAAALLLFQRRRLARDRASIIDPLIVAVGAGMLTWVFLMRPALQRQELTLLQQLVTVAYPLMDILLLAFVVRMLLVSGRRPFAYYPLVAGVLCTLAFDASYTVTTLAGTYEVGSPVDALEILFLVFLGTAALHPSMRKLSDDTVLAPETKLTRRRLALLAAASLMAPGLLALQAARREDLNIPVIVTGSVVLFLLVLIRMSGIMQTREQAIGREKLLRQTSAALVAAPDRESIYGVALTATQDLIADEESIFWAGVATGPQEKVTVVAATDDPAGEAVGAQIYLDEYPDDVRSGLLEGRVVEAEHLNITKDLRVEDLGFDPKTRRIFLTPLLAQARIRGVIFVLTDSALTEDSKATLEAFGREVTLALESVALTEEAHRRQSEERFRALIQNSSDVVAIVGADGATRYVSPVVERVLGYKPEDGLGRNVFRPPVMHPDDADRVQHALASIGGSPGAEATVDFRLRHADGRWVQIEATTKNLLADPSIGGIVVNYRDITERRTLEERLRHQAFHDPLTELPNRALFMNRLGHALSRMERSGRVVAILFLDLDNFKLVNDSLGHEAGDRLLVAVAERLRGCLREEDTAARFGGDEFTILLEDVTDATEAVRVANTVTRVILAPFDLESREVFVTTSIGIVLATSGRDRPTDLLRNADVALYRAKASGKATYEVFDDLMNLQALERLDLEADLRRAIDQREFSVHYQPQLDLQTGIIVGYEALVRWMHPERGPIPPGEFLPVAEETGLVFQIGGLVLEEACRQAQEWHGQHPNIPLKMSVNISARQLQRPDELVSEVIRVLDETELAPRSLVLEITESMLMGDAEHNVDALGKLKALGIGIAVDDFGTGYSNLAYLRRFPVDFLKIDKAFVDGLENKSEDKAIVKAIVDLAAAMGMQTVAEGIETTGQANRLRALKCKLGQGYYFAESLSADEAGALLVASPSTPGRGDAA